MSWGYQVVASSLALLAVTLILASWWMCGWADKVAEPHSHLLILDPNDIKAQVMVCKCGCGYEQDIPRGAPQEPVERIQWARALGLLPWQNGRSVAFLEALRAD